MTTGNFSFMQAAKAIVAAVNGDLGLKKDTSAVADDKPWRERALEQVPTGNPDLNFSTDAYEVSIVSDGTTTRIEIFDRNGNVVGQGSAVRRQGERRNSALGSALAAARAHQDAAGYYAEMAEEMLS